jgi:hypothetical protein
VPRGGVGLVRAGAARLGHTGPSSKLRRGHREEGDGAEGTRKGRQGELTSGSNDGADGRDGSGSERHGRGGGERRRWATRGEKGDEQGATGAMTGGPHQGGSGGCNRPRAPRARNTGELAGPPS